MEQKLFQKLLSLGKESALLKSVNYLVSWDQETYMPQNASLARAEQLELMASLIHKSEIRKTFAATLSKLIDLDSGKVVAKTLNPKEKAALREWRRSYLLAAKLPLHFVKRFAKITSESMHVWAQAKKENAFEKFAPYLTSIVQLAQEKAEYLGYKEHPYDALLDEYEPDMTKKQISSLFTELKKPMTRLLQKIESKKRPDTHFLQGNFPHEKQMQAGIFFLKEMGYDFSHGRIDISSHPFSTSMHPTDSRVTTRVDPNNFMSNISACFHEGGHALYEMGLPLEYFGSPLCETISLGIHESQSRFWETRIGQSKAFCRAYLPYLKKMFSLEKVDVDAFYKAINLVNPSFIRVDADEVTYSLHVILRFELECALIEGKLKTKDLPEAWNAKMKEYLGITPKNNREGCLQDVHWSMGGFGYFPTYTLGNLYASHLFLAFEQAFPTWEEKIASEGLLFVKEWLNKSIHIHGKAFRSVELIEKVAKKPFTAKAFVDYLEKKYSEIYNL